MKAKLSNELKALLSNKHTADRINQVLLNEDKDKFYIRYKNRVYRIHKRDIKSYTDSNTISQESDKDMVLQTT